MIGILQPVADNPVDQIKQPTEQHVPQENVDLTLRKSTRVRN